MNPGDIINASFLSVLFSGVLTYLKSALVYLAPMAILAIVIRALIGKPKNTHKKRRRFRH